MKLTFLAIFVMASVLTESAQAYFCRVNPDQSYGTQYSPAYQNSEWIDNSPSTDFRSCDLQLRSMLVFRDYTIYCRVNPNMSNGIQFSPAYVGGDWLDSSPSTTLDICLEQLREMQR